MQYASGLDFVSASNVNQDPFLGMVCILISFQIIQYQAGGIVITCFRTENSEIPDTGLKGRPESSRLNGQLGYDENGLVTFCLKRC